jgi:hypothetical protein
VCQRGGVSDPASANLGQFIRRDFRQGGSRVESTKRLHGKLQVRDRLKQPATLRDRRQGVNATKAARQAHVAHLVDEGNDVGTGVPLSSRSRMWSSDRFDGGETLRRPVRATPAGAVMLAQVLDLIVTS